MGFCVINLTYRRQSFGPIRFLSAGEAQIVICAPYVHLTAIVETDNLAAYSTLWEQISGSPVILIGDPNNTLQISYEQTATGDDKVFRFWVNKGQESAMYRDVMIYGTPIDQVPLGFAIESNVNVRGIESNIFKQANIFSLPSAKPKVADSGESVHNDSEVWIGWTLDTQNAASLLYVDVEENSTGVYRIVARIYSHEPQFYRLANAAHSYRITATYQQLGLPQTYRGDATRSSLGNNLQVSDPFAGIMIAQNVVGQELTRTTRTRVVLEEVDLLSIGFSPAFDLQTSFTRTTRSRIDLEFVEENYLNLAAMYEVSDLTRTVSLKTRLQVGG